MHVPAMQTRCLPCFLPLIAQCSSPPRSATLPPNSTHVFCYDVDDEVRLACTLLILRGSSSPLSSLLPRLALAGRLGDGLATLDSIFHLVRAQALRNSADPRLKLLMSYTGSARLACRHGILPHWYDCHASIPFGLF